MTAALLPISWRPGRDTLAAIENQARALAGAEADRLRRSGHSTHYSRTIEFESSDSPERVEAELLRALGYLWPNVRVR